MANTFTFANQTLTDADIFGGISYICDLNTGDEFSIGNTASASVSFVTDKQVPLYTKDQTNGFFEWTQDNVSRGKYYVTEVTKVNGTWYSVTAYDAMILLETSITSLSLSYPLTVSAAASAIAAYIGCTVSGTIYNGTMACDALDDTTTIRELLGWVAEASGASVKIDAADHIVFLYYAASGITVTASDYKEDGLDVADYTCAAIDNVTICDMAGMTAATAGSGTNSLFIQGNPFMYEATSTEAAVILGLVDSFVYAPFTCEMFDENGLDVGMTATFGTVTTLVMHIESDEDGAVASAVGSDSRAEFNKSLDIIVNEALAVASDAQQTAQELNLHFWYTPSGSEAGAHIAEVDKPTFEANPTGGNLLSNSAGVKVREGTKVLAEMSKDGFDAKTYDANDNEVTIAHLGYGPGTNSGGGTSNAPYYTFGTRRSGFSVGNYSVAEGLSSVASGEASHAEGYQTQAEAHYSHAEGWQTIADQEPLNIGFATHQGIHAGGTESIAYGNTAFVHGKNAIAHTLQTVIGISNIETTDNGDTILYEGITLPQHAFVIGNGSLNGDTRSNAFTVDWSGNTVASGIFESKGSGYSSKFGCQNVSGCHIYTDAPTFYFNKGIGMVNNGSIGSTTYPAGGLVLKQACWVAGMTSGGVLRNMCAVSGNDLFFGYGSYSGSAGNVYFDGNIVNIRSRNNVNVTGTLVVDSNRIKNLYAYNNTTTYQTNVYINSSGYYNRTTNTSSKRYKHDIKDVVSKELDPHHLYDIEVKQFKYNDDVVTDKNDCRYGKDLIGFISEQVKEVFPIAVDINENGECEAWHTQYMIPPMLALIQEQHKRIEALERRLS